MSDSHPPSSPQNERRVATTTPPAPPNDSDYSGPRGRGADKISRNFGRYRLGECLGRGGMGVVFKAHDAQLDRTVALKIPFLADEGPELRQRFAREARAAATLQHANICPVFDVGEFRGTPYLTMAFIEGRSLAKALEAGQLFTPAQIALLVRKLARAMHEAHAHGVVHRDLKPANVLLRPNGEPVIMDFGLARRGDDDRSAGLTRRGELIGTLEYMAPEQVEGDNAAVSPSADVYALGVVLYELLTGRRPFAGSSTALIAAVLLRQPRPPSELRPGVPAQLEEICARAMAKHPAERYPTMAQFAAALTEFLRGPQSTAPYAAHTSESPPTPPPSARTQPIPEDGAAQVPDRRNRLGGSVDKDSPSLSGARRQTRSAPRSPRPSARRRAKAKKETYLPIILGGAAVAVACVFLVVVVVMRPRGEPGADRSAASQSAAVPAPQSASFP